MKDTYVEVAKQGVVAPSTTPASGDGAAGGGAADAIRPLVDLLLGGRTPVRFEFWDASALGPPDGPGTVRIKSVDAIRRMLWAPGELGLARAFVAGNIEIDGDIFEVLRALDGAAPGHLRRLRVRALPVALRAARRLGILGPPPPRPAEEVRPTGRRHSPARDARAVTHHYDVGNDFYQMVLGASMTYSCARFVDATMSLEDAQASKHELVCSKLGLRLHRGARLLDVGCGWGTMALHAARAHDARVVGVTLSAPQAEFARKRVKDAGLEDQIEIRVQDYRQLGGERFDAISSIGMFEHVGASRMAEYFETLHALLAPRGRLLNHAISTPGGSRIASRSFIGRYVFPDGELLDVGEVVLAMQRAGLEVRDVESLREHYSKTLHTWVENLQSNWDAAVALVGSARANIWRLYMAASANNFDNGHLSVHQVLGVVPDAHGDSAMSPTRAGWC
jgi:cyclopropane-fatty-acyl-phospholipid synthase